MAFVITGVLVFQTWRSMIASKTWTLWNSLFVMSRILLFIIKNQQCLALLLKGFGSYGNQTFMQMYFAYLKQIRSNFYSLQITDKNGLSKMHRICHSMSKNLSQTRGDILTTPRCVQVKLAFEIIGFIWQNRIFLCSFYRCWLNL